MRYCLHYKIAAALCLQESTCWSCQKPGEAAAADGSSISGMHLLTFTAVRVCPSQTALCTAVFIFAYASLGVAARSLQQSSGCTSGVDVTSYGADASGQVDSSQAFNEAIVAASTERKSIISLHRASPHPLCMEIDTEPWSRP